MEFDWDAAREWLLVGGGLALLIRAFTDVRGQDKSTAASVMQTAVAQSGAFTSNVLERLARVEEQLAAALDELAAERAERYTMLEEHGRYRAQARLHIADLGEQVRRGTTPGTSPVPPPAGFTP